MDTQEELLAGEEEVEEEKGVQQQEDEEPQQRTVRPNQQFLARMLHGVTKGNQRVIDTNVSRAARKAVGASGAASLRPVLNRAVKQGPAAVRRTALTAAQQQKLTLCTSLLREVAMTFGFKLRVHSQDGTLISTTTTAVHGTAAAAGNNQPAVGSAAKQAAGQLEQCTEEDTTQGGMGHQEKGPPGSPQSVLLDELHVSLLLAGQHDGDADDEEDWESSADAQGLKASGKISRGTALLAGAGNSKQGARAVSRPRIALGCLEGLSHTLQRASASAGTSPTYAGGMGVAAVLMQAARRRALARQGSHKSQAGSDDILADNEEQGQQQTQATGRKAGRASSRELADEGQLGQSDGDAEGQQQASAAAPGSRAGKARIVWQPDQTGSAGVAADTAYTKQDVCEGARTPVAVRTAAAATVATPASAPAAGSSAAARKAPIVAQALSTAMDAAVASVAGKAVVQSSRAVSGGLTESNAQPVASAHVSAAAKQRAAAHTGMGRTSMDSSVLGTSSSSDAALKDAGTGAAGSNMTPAVRSLSTAALRSAGLVGTGSNPVSSLQGDVHPATDTIAAGATQLSSGGSSVKRPPASTLNGLFSAAMRDLKKVKQVLSDEGS